MLVVLRFSKLNGQMNSKDLAMVGGICFPFFFFFASSLDTVSLAPGFGLASKTKTADEKGRGPWLLLRQEQECKNSEKGVGRESVRSLGFESSWENAPEILCGTEDRSCWEAPFLCFLKSFTGLHPLVHTAREEENIQSGGKVLFTYSCPLEPYYVWKCWIAVLFCFLYSV